jgi:hypothetical protein
MATDADIKKSAVSKHTDHLVFYLHSFPISKNGPGVPLTFDALEALRKQPTFHNDVIPIVKVSIIQIQYL